MKLFNEKFIRMKISGSVILFLFLILAACTANSQKANDPPPFFFIQVTDPQFGMFESNKGFDKETELYNKAVDAINMLNPDFVVITGDLVNNKDDKSQIGEFKRITAKINSRIPVYYSPGNHDTGMPPEQKDIDSFISTYGPDRFSFIHKKCLFIGLNSCIIKANTPVLEQLQFEWLKNELLKNKYADHTIIFSHYPFFINTADEPENYSNIPADTRNRYLKLFEENKVDAVFVGHLHSNVSAKYDNIDMIISGAVGKSLSKDPSGIRVVKVYTDRIESTFFGLDEIPEKIILTDKNPVK
jgi:serine/threonine-protein phosphatase CPPED1